MKKILMLLLLVVMVGGCKCGEQMNTEKLDIYIQTKIDERGMENKGRLRSSRRYIVYLTSYEGRLYEFKCWDTGACEIVGQ